MASWKKAMYLFFFVLLFIVSGCEIPDPEPDGCYYDIDGSDHIDSVRVFYPCSLEDDNAPYHATTLSPGFGGSKEDMYWLAEHLVDEANMVVFAVTASPNITVNSYRKTHVQCFGLMQSENDDPDSLLYQRLDKRAIMGYSMGGGGVLDASNDLGDELDAVVAMAPFRPEKSLEDTSASVLILVGQDDEVAPPKYSEDGYNALPGATSKCMMQLLRYPHGNWSNAENLPTAATPKLLIVDWMDLSLNGNTAKTDTFLNPPADVVVNWNNL